MEPKRVERGSLNGQTALVMMESISTTQGTVLVNSTGPMDPFTLACLYEICDTDLEP